MFCPTNHDYGVMGKMTGIELAWFFLAQESIVYRGEFSYPEYQYAASSFVNQFYLFYIFACYLDFRVRCKPWFKLNVSFFSDYLGVDEV